MSGAPLDRAPLGSASLNRRQFLANCGAAALLPAAARALLAAPRAPNAPAQDAGHPPPTSGNPGPDYPPPGGDMAALLARPPRAAGKRALKKAVSLGMVEGPGSVREKFALLRELGFDGVELDSPGGPDRDEVLAALHDTGLAVSEVVDSQHWSSTLSDPDAAVRAKGAAALQAALDDAAHWGAGSVLLVPAVVNKSVSYDAAWERSSAEIRNLVPRAAELKVAISIENVWNSFLLSPLEAARYVDQFDSPWVGWHFDVGNVINIGWPEQWIAILGTRIKRLHIKEYSRKKRDAEGPGKGFDVELLEGDNDWPAVMAALDNVGYAGWATAEVPGGNRARLADIAARMDRIFAS